MPDNISDDEYLVRFLTSSRWFNTTAVRPAAFLPYKGETSVSRHDPKPSTTLWKLADKQNLPNVYGAAIVKARDIRNILLQVIPDEPPPRHAVIRNWPVNDDPTYQKAQQLELALKLAVAAGKALLKGPASYS